MEEIEFDLKNKERLSTFKKVIDRSFPKLFERVRFEDISTILILQIKGSDVHPRNRHPDFFYQADNPKVISGEKRIGQPINKKTQLDITAPLDLPTEQSPVTALVTPGPQTATYHPVEIFHPIDKDWVVKNMKVQPNVDNASGPAPNQARLLIGGTDLNSWSSELWANMGHYESDKNGHIIFVRSGKDTPVCFTIPRNLDLENLLLDGGNRRGPSIRFKHLVGTPSRKSLVIVGKKPVHKSLSIEFMYIVTQPGYKGWVKIGKTKQNNPKNRLDGYNNGPVQYDMNHIFVTSDCDSVEKEVIRRLNQLGTAKKGNEWYELGALAPAISVISEVIKLHPSPVSLKYPPIRNSSVGSSWVDIM